GLAFSDALVARTTGRWSIVIARGIRDDAGRFLGVTTALLDLEAFASLLAKMEIGSEGGILLRRSDTFKLMLRYPSRSEQDLNQPLPAHNPIRQRIEAGERMGTLIYTATTDGVPRLASFRQLDGYPFYVQVALAETNYLAAWHLQAIVAGGLTAAFALVLGLIMVRMIRADARATSVAQQLANNEKRMELALWGGDLGLWDWHVPSGEVVFNERWCAMLGYRPDEITPHVDSWGHLVHPDDWGVINAALEPHLKGETPAYESEHRMRHKDGHWVWILDRGRVVARDAAGGPVRAVGTHLDITAQKQAEAELLRSNRELEQFSYSISHDMRQPLRMISSYLQLLQMSLGQQLDDEQREYFHFAVDGAKRLDTMLLGLLEYSRIGRKGEPPAWVESRAILDEALLFLGPAIAEAQATIHIEGEWPRLLASPDELLRLIQNLIGNALKFRVAERRPEVTLSSEITGNRWHLRVADNGIGILPDQIGRLFQVFQRLQSRSAFEGTGIGLALCRKIAEHHGGRIWVESAGEGQGCTFWIDLPRGTTE
ncbi:MAG: ATP-binding protein, partial [Pseudomonadota bacterium]